MLYEGITKSVLHQLGVGKSYKGYDYILHGINLISLDESLLHCITKVLYIDIAREYHTSSTCVERNMRKVIEVIWRDAEQNQKLITSIFGTRYSKAKPSNKEFLELLYEYVKSYNILKELFHVDKIICPISKEVCNAYNQIIEKVTNLK